MRRALRGVRDWSPRQWWLAAVFVVLLCGFLPYAPLLGQLPWGADATHWVTDGSLDNPRWWHWATATKHFIGYRPVTALSYVFNHATTGYATLGYRGLDLSLHLGIGLLLFAVFRSFTGDRAGWGLVAVVLMCGHPATEEVLPYLARRSYLLATFFGLLALWMWARASRDRRLFSPWAPVVALTLAAAVLSNEMAYVLVPLLPLLGWSMAPDRSRWRPVLHFLPTVIVCGLAAARRWQVLGSLRGGYAKKYFAVWHNGRPMWRELKQVDHVEIARAAWSYVLDPISVSGHAPLYMGLALGLLGLAVAWLAWAALVRPATRWRYEAERLPWILALWLVGGTALIVLSETWFWRQGYLLLIPLSLLIATTMRNTLRPLLQAETSVPRRRWAAALIPPLLLVAPMLWNAPYWGGMDRAPHLRSIRAEPTVRRVSELTAELEGPALVWLVLPARSNRAHMVRIWASRYGDARGVSFKVLAALGPTGKELDADAEVVTNAAGDLELVLDGEHFQWAATPGAPGVRSSPTLPLHRLWLSGRRKAWLLVLDADDELLIEVPEPAQGERLPGLPPIPARRR